MTDQEFEALLCAVLTEPVGLRVAPSCHTTFVRAFYRVRAKAREQGNEVYDEISLLRPASGDILLVRRREA